MSLAQFTKKMFPSPRARGGELIRGTNDANEVCAEFPSPRGGELILIQDLRRENAKLRFPSPRGGELILVVFAIAGIVFLAFPSPRGGELIRQNCTFFQFVTGCNCQFCFLLYHNTLVFSKNIL